MRKKDRYVVTKSDIRQGTIRQRLRRSRGGLKRSDFPKEILPTLAYMLRRGEVVRCPPSRCWGVYKLAYRVENVDS